MSKKEPEGSFCWHVPNIYCVFDLLLNNLSLVRTVHLSFNELSGPLSCLSLYADAHVDADQEQNTWCEIIIQFTVCGTTPVSLQIKCDKKQKRF